MRLAAWLTLALAVGCGFSKSPGDATGSRRPPVVDAAASVPGDAPLAERDPRLEELTYEARTYRMGDRVRTVLSPGAVNIGTIKPGESGHPRVLETTPGLTGVIVGFQRIENYKGYGFTVLLAVVRWDAQPWHEQVDATTIFEPGRAYTADELTALNRKALTAGPEVRLPSFTTTINLSYLQK